MMKKSPLPGQRWQVDGSRARLGTFKQVTETLNGAWFESANGNGQYGRRSLVERLNATFQKANFL